MKRVLKIAQMQFNMGFHLGYGIGEEYDRSAQIVYSDTISGALCSVWAGQTSTVKTFLDSFVLSSAMPIYRGRLFMPLPLDKHMVSIKDEPDAHKRIKRLQWVELPMWEEMAQTGRLVIDEQMISDCGSAIAVDSGNGITIQRAVVEQKVSVPVTGGDAEPYYFDKVYLGEGVSLGVIYETNDEKSFRRAFRLLADSGIGTSKSIGNGSFDVDFLTYDIEVDPTIESVQMLSMWIPQREECAPEVLERSSYRLKLRGGYMAGASNFTHRHLMKLSVNMIESGSLIWSRDLKGTIVDLRPADVASHPVWRDGRALYLPFKKL